MSIRILLVDDHAIMRDGLRNILQHEPGWEVAGEAENGRQAVKMANQLCPDVVVMDFAMPDLNGAEATRQMLTHDPKIKVIALSMYADRQFVQAMLDAGALGYVVKDSSSGELRQAIREVIEKGTYLSPKVAEVLLEKPARRRGYKTVPVYELLSRREREVLQLLAEGKTSKEIGEELGIAEKTVEIHRSNIMQKLNLHSVAKLTKFAVREGLTSL